MDEAVILAACRTPIGRFVGGLASLEAPALGAVVVREAVRRAGGEGGVDAAEVDEVVMGHVLSAGVGQAPARQAALGAGLPATVAAATVNKVCGSGLKAVMMAAQAVRLGDARLVVAGGMESMSRAPLLVSGTREGWKLGNRELVDSMLYDGLQCAFSAEHCHMGAYAEHTARAHDIGRAEQDAYAAQSQRRAAAAVASCTFGEEIVPVEVEGAEEPVKRDEGPRPDTTVESLAKLTPAFEEGGTVTAGNASMLSDGAAAVVVSSLQLAQRRGWRPMARIVAYATAGVEPRDLFIAPVYAVRKVLGKAGLTLADIDLFEINEAFAAQMLACLRGLDLSDERVNVHGGAIALGHPIGASGARVLVTLLHAMKRRGARWGLASLCLGGGNAVAMIVERDA